MNVKVTIKEFLEFVHIGEPLEEVQALISQLDALAYSMRYVSFEFDETEYPEAPTKEYDKVRAAVIKRFPSLGYYNVAQNVSKNVSKNLIIIGDAIDDIADIIGDLQEVMWCFNNTSNEDALWHYQNSFTYHWGRHLRDLQLYLHDLAG